jgi:competence protein ComEC
VARKPIVIDFWDVGQGDATIIRQNPSQAFIIDVGPRNSPIIDWVAQNRSLTIEGIVLTHNDADHAGAIAALVDAARFRIGCVYFLADRNIKDFRFVQLFSRLDAAAKAGEIKKLLRLEAPQVVWRDATGSVEVIVRHPDVTANLVTKSPNATSGILTLNVKNRTRIIWAGDASIEVVAQECHGQQPEYMVGPHHGAPSDRANPLAERWLAEIAAQTTLISVGSNNRYDHPQPSFIRKSLRCGSRIMCTQLTALCDRSRRRDVVKSHARLGLPQPNTGVACRGPVRVMLLPSGDIVGDELDAEHQIEIRQLERPKCLLLAPKKMLPR